MLIFLAIIYVESIVYRPVSLVSELLNIDKKTLFTIVHIESGFYSGAVSKKGAVGLFQVMPGNLKALNADRDSFVENIIAGAILFKRYLRKYDGDLVMALAAYNAGPSAVKKYNGIPPYKETIGYVKKFKKFYEKYSYIEKKKEDKLNDKTNENRKAKTRSSKDRIFMGQ